jgi:cathepsin L
MNPLLFCLVSFFSLFSCFNSQNNLRGNDYWKQFVVFQERFNKYYDSLQELEHRFQIFASNLVTIYQHNILSISNYTLSINQYSDLTSGEFKDLISNGFKKSPYSFGAKCAVFKKSGSTVPDTLDWREKGVVTPVKDQGQCGSCWSFSATGSMEGAWALKQGKLISLSEQQLVDCSKRYGNLGCNGGQMDSAFDYAIDYGMCSEESYPYISGITLAAGTCESCEPLVKITKCLDVTANDQLALKEAVALGPVSIALEADTRIFQSYSGGVITDTKCGTNLDHGVLIVGYGSENGIKYWLVKNSWGSTWGDEGYVKIERSDSTNDQGVCGIAMEPSFPVV